MTGVLTAMAGPGGPVWLLAYRPFLDPLELHDAWWTLLVPLALGISIAYKAVRVGDMSTYWRQVVVMTIQIVVAMILLALASYLFIEVYLPWLFPA